jgi:hypothetical protein
MKFLSVIILLSLAFAPAPAQRRDPAPAPDAAEDFALERRAAADPNVNVSLCLASGDVIVRGWDRSEVRARAAEAGALVLQTDSAQPARRVEVLISEGEGARVRPGECGLTSGLELNVPRGASVSLRIHEGDVAVSDVAELTVNDMSGDVEVRGVSRSAEVSTMSGDVSFSDSKGRARLRAVSGSIQATGAEPLADGDSFEASSTSGDVELDGVRHARVTGSTISGNVRMTGALAPGGTYAFKSISGDVTLALPADSSFRLNAKVVLSGEIVTDFPVRAANISPPDDEDPPAPRRAPSPPPARPRPGGVPAPPPPPAPAHPRPTRLVGTVGAGDAAVDLSSFSGTLHLKRQ